MGRTDEAAKEELFGFENLNSFNEKFGGNEFGKRPHKQPAYRQGSRSKN